MFRLGRVQSSLLNRAFSRYVRTYTIGPAITKPFDATIQGFVKTLGARQPCFNVSSKHIRIMQQPKEFYQCLLDMIARAERDIYISSLYIGSKDGELIDALHRSLSNNHRLKIHLLLDLNRSTRPGTDSTARILLPLLKEFPDRIRVSLFRSPKLKGLMAKLVPPRYNEGWGTWHPKIYGVDDEVMLSGANLNESYFTNRQDRYIHFENATLAAYCRDFLQASSLFTYQLLASPSTTEGYKTLWKLADTHPHHIEILAQATLSDFQARWRTQSLPRPVSQDPSEAENTGQFDTLVMPIIQGGQFAIREEELALSTLFHELSVESSNSPTETDAYNGPLMDLTSGYFGLYKNYRELILQTPLRYRIIAAGPKANGFYGSKGISGRIPEGYTLLEQRFMRAVRTADYEWPHDVAESTGRPGVQLSEWEQEGWTYHAKGIWLRPTPKEDPCLTLFGSTNLNSRSANLDTELSFILATSCPDLRRRLGQEVDGLRAHAHTWRGAERRVRLGTKALVAAVGGML